MNEQPRKVLVLFAHPAIDRSHANRRLIDGLDQMPGVTFHDLYEAYPDLHIDVRAEQALLTQHDVIVLHFPLFWYSSPALLKEWQDLVLQHGWAYGKTGDALEGKALINAVTTGGAEEAYGPNGYNRFPLRQLLTPFEATASLCGMTYLAPFVVHAAHCQMPGALDRHAADYRRLLTGLRDGHVDLDRLQRATYANTDLDALIAPHGG